MFKPANSNPFSLFGKGAKAESQYVSVTTSPVTGETVVRMQTRLPNGTRRYFVAERDVILDKIKSTQGAQKSEWEVALAALDHHKAMATKEVGAAAGA